MLDTCFYFNDSVFTKSLNRPGIYGIFCITSKKWYIGQALRLAQRLRDHRARLVRGRHPNEHLNSSCRKYGVDSMLFFILEHCPQDELNTKEAYYIKYYNTMDDRYGFNKTFTDVCTVYSEQTISNRKFAQENRITSKKHLAPLIRQAHPEKSIAQISKEFNTCRKSVRGILSNRLYYDRNYTPSILKFPETKRLQTEAKIKQLAISGCTKDQIRKELKTSSSFMTKVLRDIKIRHTSLILNCETGIYYNSVGEAAESANINKSTLTYWLSNPKYKHKTSFISVADKSTKKSNNKRYTLILNSQTGVYYENYNDAAESVSILPQTLRAWLTYKSKNNKTPFQLV